jgi:hypothetical protein
MRRSCLSKFGIAVEQYEAMLEAQGGVCAMCRAEPSDNRQLAVDHDHVTGVVRALLCSGCNRRLGIYEALRESAATYLGQFGEGNPLLPSDHRVQQAKVPTQRQRPGWKPATTKLTDGIVADIRDRYAAGGVSQRQLAAEFETSQINVSRIVRAETWRAGNETEQ